MNGQGYLTERGQEIYNEILDFIKDKGLDDSIDTFELSILANNFDMYGIASDAVKAHGYSQQTQSGYSQITADYTVMKQCADYIAKHSDKFGLNPSAREKIKAFSKKEKETDGFAELMRGLNK
jgi:P27 family predicted phage terminase small subunit